jgi:CRP-like cAMP-binding protein
VTGITYSAGGLVYKHFMMSAGEATNELYAGLSDDLRQELVEHEQAATFSAGATLLQCGIPADRLVILTSGSAETFVYVAGEPRSLGIARPGKVFALDSIISGEPLHTSVTCSEDCGVTFVPKAIFLDVLRRNPQMYFAVAKVLSSDLAAADRIIRTYGRSPAAKTVAKRSLPV